MRSWLFEFHKCIVCVAAMLLEARQSGAFNMQQYDSWDLETVCVAAVMCDEGYVL